MVVLLILKHIRNLKDEDVGEHLFTILLHQSGQLWKRNFCKHLVKFRNGIGKEGKEMISKESLRINGKDSEE
jgi:IS5 family transposase